LIADIMHTTNVSVVVMMMMMMIMMMMVVTLCVVSERFQRLE